MRAGVSGIWAAASVTRAMPRRSWWPSSGAAFLCADLGLAVTPRPDHAAYVQSWLKVLRGDTRAIFTAAAKAQAAADYIHERITLRHQAETGEAVARAV